MAESQGERITEATTMQTARLIEMGQLATVDPDGQRADYPIALLLTFDDADSIRAAIREGKVGFVFGDEPERSKTSVQAAPRSGVEPGTLSWAGRRSEEHKSELQSLMSISHAVACYKKKTLSQT